MGTKCGVHLTLCGVLFIECLESLGLLIQNNGLSVCGTAPQKVIPLIAAQISDRDNAVRSAALNTLVMVYGNVGDQVYKLAGQVMCPAPHVSAGPSPSCVAPPPHVWPLPSCVAPPPSCGSLPIRTSVCWRRGSNVWGRRPCLPACLSHRL